MLVLLIVVWTACLIGGFVSGWKKYKNNSHLHIVEDDTDLLFEDNTNREHPGHCTGDCANCPPHYGYRYGRWYYGHDHSEGCEFGGNKCSGSRD